jgi:very-short-patch-repair endonuclease
LVDQRTRQFRANATDAERRLWRELRVLKLKGLHFRRQTPMGRYYVDFVCHGANLVVELDGRQHSGSSAVAHDMKRTEFLHSRGYTVLRFWNFEVMRNRQSVVDAIFTVATSPPPEICSR